MQKITSLFQRDWEGDSSRVLDIVSPGAEWVIEGEGVATRKWDGTNRFCSICPPCNTDINIRNRRTDSMTRYKCPNCGNDWIWIGNEGSGFCLICSSHNKNQLQ